MRYARRECDMCLLTRGVTDQSLHHTSHDLIVSNAKSNENRKAEHASIDARQPSFVARANPQPGRSEVASSSALPATADTLDEEANSVSDASSAKAAAKRARSSANKPPTKAVSARPKRKTKAQIVNEKRAQEEVDEVESRRQDELKRRDSQRMAAHLPAVALATSASDQARKQQRSSSALPREADEQPAQNSTGAASELQSRAALYAVAANRVSETEARLNMQSVSFPQSPDAASASANPGMTSTSTPHKGVTSNTPVYNDPLRQQLDQYLLSAGIDNMRQAEREELLYHACLRQHRSTHNRIVVLTNAAQIAQDQAERAVFERNQAIRTLETLRAHAQIAVDREVAARRHAEREV